MKRGLSSVPDLPKNKKIKKKDLKKREPVRKEAKASSPDIFLEKASTFSVLQRREVPQLYLNIKNKKEEIDEFYLTFPKDSQLAELNNVFKDNPKFLAMLVSAWDPRAKFEDVRQAFDGVSQNGEISLKDIKLSIEKEDFNPENAQNILLPFLHSSRVREGIWEGVSQQSMGKYAKREFQALPRGIGRFLYLLGQKAIQAQQKPQDSQLEAFFSALQNTCKIDEDQSSLDNNLGRMSEICKVSLNGKSGFFKKCFDIGQKIGNFVPEQIFDYGHFHFKNASIAERNIFFRKLAQKFGRENLCAQTELACLDGEVGNFSEKADGKVLADYFPAEKSKPGVSSVPYTGLQDNYKNSRGGKIQFKTNEESYERLSHVSNEIKFEIVNQMLCLEALNVISGELDPNRGNLNLNIDEECNTAQLVAFDRDYSFGDNEYMEQKLGENLLGFSSQEVFDKVTKFDANEFGKGMENAGFPNSQVQAMKNRHIFFKKYLYDLEKNGKIFDKNGMNRLIASNFGEAIGKHLLPKHSDFNQTLSWELELLEALKRRGKEKS